MSAEVDLQLAAGRLAHYRAMSTMAIVAMGLGFLSVAAILSATLLILPLCGVIFSVAALTRIRSRPLELTGMPLAVAGLAMSCVMFLGGAILHTVVYVTEVPEGYQRISFFDLQPDKRSALHIPESAVNLDGQRIFIKGYVYPGDQRHDLRQFVLVPDMGTCCFGGQPALTDMVEVNLKEPLRVDFSYRKRRLGGILHVDTTLKPISGLNGVYYQLDADYLN